MKNLPGWLLLPYGILIGLITGAAILLITRQPTGQAITLEPRPTLSPILVHIDGAVKSPGVYPFEAGSRIEQAINSAGGLTGDADIKTINLASMLMDGQKIHIPRQGETPPPQSENGAFTVEKINLNTATLEELITLPGIGEDRARAIIAYREKTGGFRSIEEIQNIEGIGPATFEKLKDLIQVLPSP